MRVLVAASGGEGHLGPLLPFAAAARVAGDDVLVVVPPEQEATLQAADLPYELTPGVPVARVRAIRDAMAAGTPADRVRLAEVELFGRACTESALPTIEAVCDRVQPELIVREPCDHASAIAAHRRHISMAQIAISPGQADWNGLHLAAEVVEDIEPGTTAAVEASPYLSRFPEVSSHFSDSRAYGFAVDTGPRREEDPPLMWITFGTVNSAFTALEATWRTVLDTVDGFQVHAIASTGRGNHLHLTAAPGVEIVDWVEMKEILARASAVICHGGSGTTLATLAAGVPLVIVPLIADQFANAAMIEALGAGIVVSPAARQDGALQGLQPEDTSRVRAALERVLTDDRYALAARRAAQELAERMAVEAALQQLREDAVRSRP